MSGDGSFLWSDGAGNVASAVLLLVLGWILGQLRWGYMLITGLAIAVVLLAFLACRYFYARRHPKPHPLTTDDLSELLDKFSKTIDTRPEATPVDVPAAESIPDIVVVAEPDQPAPAQERLWIDLDPKHLSSQRDRRLYPRDARGDRPLTVPSPPLAPRWQSLRQTVGLL
jgi:hypothetical protein